MREGEREWESSNESKGEWEWESEGEWDCGSIRIHKYIQFFLYTGRKYENLGQYLANEILYGKKIALVDIGGKC